MKVAALWLHIVIVLLALLGCTFFALSSLSNFGFEPFAITYERGAIGLLCGLFAASHIFLAAKRQLTVPVALLFYPLFLLLAISTSVVARGSTKSWAPASASESLFSNILGYGVISALVIACAATCYWSISQSRRSNA